MDEKCILVVDDEVRLVKLVKAYLEQVGYRVVTASNGRDALFVAREEVPDLIVLDIMMPKLDGYDFVKLHRHEANTPIILLTARVEEDDRVKGLELGADDYVTKPFSPRELVARVNAVLRRANGVSADSNASKMLSSGELRLDLDGYCAYLQDKRIDLTRTEFLLLQVLMQSPNRVFSRQALLDKAQGEGYFEGYERNIDAHIKNLRAKIEENPREPRYIETVYGVGYRFGKGVSDTSA